MQTLVSHRESRIAHCREQVLRTAPEQTRKRLEQLRKTTADLNHRQYDFQCGDLQRYEAKAREQHDKAVKLKDELQGMLKNPENAGRSNSIVKKLKEVAESLPSLRAKLTEASERVLDPAVIAARQVAAMREYNELVESLFDWQQIDFDNHR